MRELALAWSGLARAALPAAVELRHQLHADPRLSGREEETTRLLVEAFECGPGFPTARTGRLLLVPGVGNDVDGGTGTGMPSGGSGGNGALPDGAIALRAELDALPVRERTSVPWAATNGAMHACGHDVHMAALFAVATAARSLRLPFPLLALLQPREEGADSGARDVVAEGLLTGASAVVAAHVQPQLVPGTISARPGPVNAGSDEFTVTVTGRGGHAGYPHAVDDSVLALSAIVVALQQVGASRIDPVRGAVCGVNQIAAGSSPNVVPSSATAYGSVRTMTADDRHRALAAIEETVVHVAAAYGCEGTVRVDPCEPPLVNDPTLAAAVVPLLEVLGHPVSTAFQSFGADDFSMYGEVPGLMLFVGTGNAGGGLHEETYLPADHYVGTVADALIAGYCAAAAQGAEAEETR